MKDKHAIILGCTIGCVLGWVASDILINNIVSAFDKQHETLITEDMQDGRQFIRDCFVKNGRPSQQDFVGGVIELKCSWKELDKPNNQ